MRPWRPSRAFPDYLFVGSHCRWLSEFPTRERAMLNPKANELVSNCALRLQQLYCERVAYSWVQSACMDLMRLTACLSYYRADTLEWKKSFRGLQLLEDGAARRLDKAIRLHRVQR